MDVSLPARGWHSDQGNSGSDSGPIPWGLATQFGGFKGWSLSGWRRFDIRQLGRRPSSINDAPSWHKDAHVRQRPSILKFLDIEGDNYGYSDEERVVGEEEEEVVAAGRDSWIRDHLTSHYGHHGAQAVSDIIKYYFDTSARLHRGDFQVNPPVPDQLWEEHIRCRVACPLPFNSRHPLYADYVKRIDLFCGRAITVYNETMLQKMVFVAMTSTYMDSVGTVFFITLKALDSRTGETHYCQTEVVPLDYYEPDPDPVYSVRSFARLPPVDCRGSTSFDAERFQRAFDSTLEALTSEARLPVLPRHMQAAVGSILAAISYFQITTVSSPLIGLGFFD
ncbi:hypothetical protein Tsubulata_014988 [Turnera subulata]|uniref:Uncharacterized protein n=1 Tax=Turnera subulata TaxID=218843 RepID=A0A9Q0F4F5_9ROSI|nr:hypothetical protein Tsubulata_014988 [Turnera subulata]